jgi:hypothetical protein
MQRPTSATVFGILNIGFAGMGIIGIIASIGLLMLSVNFNNPVVKVMQESPGYALWFKICIPLGLLSCGVLLAAGIGLLLVKPWGRLLSIGYAIYAIGFGIVGTVVNFLFITRPLLEQAQNKGGPEAAGAIGGAIGGSIGGCFGMIYPILLLIFMFHPAIRDAFRPATPAQN